MKHFQFLLVGFIAIMFTGVSYAQDPVTSIGLRSMLSGDNSLY